MHFSAPLSPATLIKRYKRFLADVRMDDGSTNTIHCPNSGSMRGCSTPGSRVWLSTSDNPKRKYPQTLELVEEKGTLIGVNTALTNHLVAEAIEKGRIRELQEITAIKREVTTAPGHRLDFLLECRQEQHIYLEVKNCSLAEDDLALFPDAVTARGTKHLLELARLAKAGHRAVIFFCVQRGDAHSFAPADDIDPIYGQTLREVCAKGVEPLAYRATVSPRGITVDQPLPIHL